MIVVAQVELNTGGVGVCTDFAVAVDSVVGHVLVGFGIAVVESVPFSEVAVFEFVGAALLWLWFAKVDRDVPASAVVDGECACIQVQRHGLLMIPVHSTF